MLGVRQRGEASHLDTQLALSRGPRPRALVAAIDHAEKSRYEPDVVTSLPSTGARRRTRVLPLTPTLRRLPRP